VVGGGGKSGNRGKNKAKEDKTSQKGAGLLNNYSLKQIRKTGEKRTGSTEEGTKTSPRFKTQTIRRKTRKRFKENDSERRN